MIDCYGFLSSSPRAEFLRGNGLTWASQRQRKRDKRLMTADETYHKAVTCSVEQEGRKSQTMIPTNDLRVAAHLSSIDVIVPKTPKQS